MVSGVSGDADHGNLLHISAVVTGRLEPVQRELRGNVFGGNVAATLPGPAALEQIVRQEAHVGTDTLSFNLLKCGDRGRRKMNRDRRGNRPSG